MADFLLSVGIDVGVSYNQMQKDISTLISQLNSTQPKIKVSIDVDNQLLNNVKSQISNISKELNGTGAISVNASGTKSISTDIGAISKNASSATSALQGISRAAQEAQNKTILLTREHSRYYSSLKQIDTLLNQVTNNQKKWTASQHGISSDEYNNLSKYIIELQNLKQSVQNGKITLEDFNKEMSRIRSGISSSSVAIRQAGEDTQVWYKRVASLSEKFNTWFGITRIIMAAYQTIRKMVSAVIELDTAMTELKKVTDETNATYNKFLENATLRAQSLGAKLSDVVTASADFARLGFNIDQAEKLADAAILYKNVGDGIEDISDASESIIATLQAFGDEVAPEDVMTIIDKFNEVGNNYAISSRGVGEALLRSAAAMNAANNSLDETIALATAANTIVQDPEKVGTTLKTVSMYLRAAETEAEAAGESTDGMARSVSELRDEILSLTGNKVDIQFDENNFKSTYQILKELSQEWDNLTDITQANILEMVGGKRNSNVVAALLENFSIAEEVVETSANSAGSALAENEKYLESIQGKISQFQAVFETFSQNLINGDLIKFIIEFGTGILKVLDSLQKMNLLLPAIIASVALIKSIGVAKSLVESKARVDVLTASLLKEKVVSDTLAVSISNLTLAEKRRIASSVQAAVASGSLSKEEARQILTTLGLAAAEGTLSATNKTLSASFKSLMASIPGWGWAALAVSVLIEIFNGISMAAENSTDAIKDMDSELETLTSNAQTVASDFSSLKQSADEIIPRFAELAQGVNGFGENISLTEEEYAEFIELNNKIAEMFPELDLGLDSNGNHILALSYSVDTLVESLESLVEAERLATNENIASNMQDALDNISGANEEYEKEKEALLERKDAYKEASEEINRMYNERQKYQDAYGDMWLEQYAMDADMYVDDMHRAFGSYDNEADAEAWQSMIEKYTDDETLSIDWHAVINSNEFKNEMAGVDRELDNLEKKQEVRWQKINSFVGAWLQTTDGYNMSDENVQGVLTKIIGNIDYAELGITNEEDLKSYIDKNFIQPISDAEPEVQNAMVGLFDIKSAFESGAITVGEYGITDYILGDLQSYGVNDEILSNLQDTLNLDEFKSQLEAIKHTMGDTEDVSNFINDLSYEEFNFAYKITQEQGSMSIDELREKIKQLRYEGADMVEPLDMTSLLDGLNATASAVDKITSAMTKLKEGTALSKKEILDLVNQYPQLLQQANIFSDGSVDAQKNALNAVLDMQEQEYDAQIDAKIAELKATEQVLNNQLDLEAQKANLINDIKNLEVNGKVTQEEAFTNKLQEFLDLQGQDYVSLQNGELQVNEEALNDQLAMGNEFGNKAAANIWQPYGDTIVTSHVQGYNGALTATNDYMSNLYSRIKNFFSHLSGAFAAAWNDIRNGELSNIGTYFKDAIKLGTTEIDAGTVSVNFGGTATTINGQRIDSWISDQEKASATRIEQINDIKTGVLNSIKNLEDLKGLKLTDIYASTKSSSGSKNKSEDDEENIFKSMYNYHKHLVAMEKETTSDFLKWLDSAYKAAYKQGEITLDEYYKYEEEVFDGLQDIRDEAKDALEELIDFRIDMLEKDIENEKDALDKKLDYLQEFYDKQKEMLQDEYDEEQYLEEQAEKRKSVSDLRAEISMLENDDSAWAQKRKLELEEELNSAEKELGEFEDEHALDSALDALDNAYDAQKAQIDAEMTALEEKLNDPGALYNQALTEIKSNTGNLYKEMLEFNKKYGTGKDDDVKDIYEEAYKALQEYKNIYGKDYNGVVLTNSTNYKPNSGTTSISSGSSIKNTSSNKNTSSSSSKSTSLSRGSTITVKKTATHFSAKSKNVKMKSFVPGGTYTVYQTSGNEVLIGRNGVYTGWIKKSDIVGYAFGTRRATKGLHRLDELGSEYLFTSKDGNNYRVLNSGDKVLDAKATNFLYDFANSGGNIVEKIIKESFGKNLFERIKPVITNNEINMGDIVVRGNADTQTVSEIRRAQRDNLTELLKSLNQLNK